jgi:nucleotidyltransferase/DNA polymerase involved in DNA repair
MRLLYLDWPHLPLSLELARLTSRHPASAAQLIVLGGQPWEPGSVLDCSPPASKLGVQHGQPLGSAHKLVPEALFLAAHPTAYAEAFEAALRALGELAPAVEGEIDPQRSTFGQAFVGIEGLARLWGDEATLVERAAGLLAPLLPGRPRAGIGNTRFGAQVAALAGARSGARPERGMPVGSGAPPRSGTAKGSDRSAERATPQERASPTFEAVPVGDAAVEAAFLAPLPIRLLPAEQETQDRLRLFGLTRIGELAALDRSAVVARFGAAGGTLHDLANGLDGRPLRPRRPVERLHAQVELDPPVDSLEPLRFVLRHLCGALCEQLLARGAGAGRATLLLELEGAAPRRYDQSLPEPAAAADLLERLLMARLEADPPRQPVERLHLELDGTAPAAGLQLGLFTPQLARAARLDWQLAGLVIRFGPDRLLHARLLDPEARLAQDRFSWVPVGPVPSS